MQDVNVKIESLKRQYGQIFEITSEHPETGEALVGIFRRPTLKELDLFTTLQNKGQSASGLQIIARELLLDGDDRIVEDVDFFINTVPVFNEMFAVKVATIKKL